MFAVGRTSLTSLWRSLIVFALLIPALSGCQTESPDSDDLLWSPPELTGSEEDLPLGRDVVQRTVDFIGQHDHVTFKALATYEVVQDDGQKLQFDMRHHVVVHRPNRIFWETLDDRGDVETAWFDTGEFTLLKQPANLWGRVDLPPTISEGLVRVAEEYNIVVPFLDLLSGDVAKLWLGDEVKSVNYIGEAWIDGQWTDHVAIRKSEVDLELWIRTGDEPFPAKLAIVMTQEPGLPGYTARFREWSVEVPEGTIPPFSPPEGSDQIEVVPDHGD